MVFMGTSDEAEAPPSPRIIERLVANHREFLGFLERRVGDRALAEDILQDAFVRGMAKVSELRDEESAVAWFYRLLRNAVIDQARRHGAAGRSLAAFASELAQSPEEPELATQVCRCVAELADTLKPEYAEAVRRVEIDGMTMKEFAERAGISTNNAAVRVFRAREALRKQVTRSCGSCAEHGCLDCTCSPGKHA
jgi:RNA polymerase sigma factor (sigma-70 family)